MGPNKSANKNQKEQDEDIIDDEFSEENKKV